MRKLDPSSYRTMPWKNGGGTTTEALVLPPGADQDTFDLRVSMARVNGDGPFSTYVGIDRTLVVTDGEGLTLAMADGSEVTLDRETAPFAFTGEDPVHAKLVAGAVSDFNVMTRRSSLRHRAACVLLDGARTLVCAGELALVLVLEGSVSARDQAGELTFATGEVLTLSREEEAVTLGVPDGPIPEGGAKLLVVEFFRR